MNIQTHIGELQTMKSKFAKITHDGDIPTLVQFWWFDLRTSAHKYRYEFKFSGGFVSDNPEDEFGLAGFVIHNDPACVTLYYEFRELQKEVLRFAKLNGLFDY